MAQPLLKDDYYYRREPVYEGPDTGEDAAALQLRRAERELRLQQKRREKEASVQRKNAARNIIAVLFVFAVLALVVSRYAAISANDLANYKLRENITVVEEQIKTLNLNITMKDDITQLTDEATELGMGYPSGNQVLYVPVEKKAEAPAESDGDTQEPWTIEKLFGGIVDAIEGWLE